MAGKDDELPEVGPWARDKLERLRKYLGAYTTILRKQKFKGYVYIDAFAGAGRARVRKRDPSPNEELFAAEPDGADAELRTVLDGSPRVALSLPHPFTHYVFVERDPDRVMQLERLKSEFSGRAITLRKMDCNTYLVKHLLDAVNWRQWRAVIFLDPFGMQVPWDTLTSLGATKAVEVFINFPVGMAINRLLKRSGKFAKKERAKLDAYFGDPGWYSLLYEESSPDPFGETSVTKTKNSADRLVAWYRGRLKDAFGFVSSPYLVRNTKGAPLYYLIFAGPNETGKRIASDVLNSGDRVR